MIGKKSPTFTLRITLENSVLNATIQADKQYRICDIVVDKDIRSPFLNTFKGRQLNSKSVQADISNYLKLYV